MTSRVLALAVLALVATQPPAAVADRRATRSEAAAVRAAALRSLDGTGWKVGGVRMSVVRAANRYARAQVAHRATGVGGDMLLATRRGRWRRVFLGTDGFCDARMPAAVLNDFGFGCPATVVAQPSSVTVGGKLTLRGRGFAPRAAVVLAAGPPQSEPDRIGTVRSTSTGTFVFTTPISAAATPETYVALACQRSCRIKGTASFTLVP